MTKCESCNGTGTIENGCEDASGEFCEGEDCNNCNGDGYADCMVCDGSGEVE